MTAAISTSPLSASPSLGTKRVSNLRVQSAAVPLGENLVRAGIVSNGDLEAALQQHSNTNSQLGETLLEMGFVEEDTLLLFLGQQLNVPSVRLRSGLVDPTVVRMIPRSKAEAFSVLALFCVRGRLTVAMAEPSNLRQIDELERVTGMPVRPILAMRSAIQRMLAHCYEENFAVDAVTADLEENSLEIQSDAVDISLSDVESLTDGSPIINLVNYIIVHAIRQKASDIHIEPGQQSSWVRYRVDGHLREILRPRREFHPAMISRIKVLAKLDISEHRMPQDGRIHLTVDGREIDLRVSTLPTILGEKIVMRVLDRKNVTFYLDKLGMPDAHRHG